MWTGWVASSWVVISIQMQGKVYHDRRCVFRIMYTVTVALWAATLPHSALSGALFCRVILTVFLYTSRLVSWVAADVLLALFSADNAAIRMSHDNSLHRVIAQLAVVYATAFIFVSLIGNKMSVACFCGSSLTVNIQSRYSVEYQFRCISVEILQLSRMKFAWWVIAWYEATDDYGAD